MRRVARPPYRLAREQVRRTLYGRGRRLIDAADFIARAPECWYPAVPADARVRTPPIRMGADVAELHAMALPIPELGVFELAEGRAVMECGCVFTRDGELIRETSWYGQPMTPADMPGSYGPARRVEGRCLSLVTEHAIRNYGHFVMDGLSRLEVARRAGFTLDDFDYFYLYKPPSRSAEFLLDRLGIDRAKCLFAEEVGDVIASRMLVTSFPGTRRNYSPIVAQFIASAVSADRPERGRRIYIPRRGRRQLTNSEEIETIARSLGLEMYDFRSVDNEFDYFRSVELVVGPHGSDLTNLAACAPGTKVLELIPSDHIHPYYYTIAEGAGLEYHYILGRSISHRPSQEGGASLVDFHVDPSEFENAVRTLLSQLDD